MPKKRLLRRDFDWNAELAYAIGLITTDGCLSPDKRHISLTSTDKQLLRTFKKCLRKSNRITKNTPSTLSKKKCFRVQIGDVVFYDWLLKIGLFPNKSLTLGHLDVPKKYFMDFLRGHLDGDGHVISYIDRYNTYKNPKYVYKRLFIFFSSASKKHISWIRDKIYKFLKIRGSLQENISKSNIGKNSLFSIKYSTKEAIRLINWMYYQPNLPCLKRKRDKLIKFLWFN